MKKKILLGGLFLLCFLLSACSENEKTLSSSSAPSSSSQVSSASSETDSEVSETESESTSYHLKLHDSDLEPPSAAVCLAAQERAFTDLSEDDIQLVQDTIHIWHMTMEGEFVMKNCREILGNPDSVAWELWENKDASVLIPGDTDPVGTLYDGAMIISELQSLIDIVQDQNFLKDLKKMQDTLQSAVDKHSVNELDYFHRLLHDCDYWLVNYGVQLSIAPHDWDGVNVYFNCLESLKS